MTEAITPGDTMLTVAQTATLLNVSEKSIRRYIDDGRLIAYLAGPRNIRIRFTDVQKLTSKINN